MPFNPKHTVPSLSFSEAANTSQPPTHPSTEMSNRSDRLQTLATQLNAAAKADFAIMWELRDLLDKEQALLKQKTTARKLRYNQ